MNARTIVDIRCTLKKVDGFMSAHRPGTPLWRLPLDEFIAWLSKERDQGNSPHAMAKQLSHIRGLLDYSWRSGRADRNVLDGFSLQDTLPRSEPRALTLAEAERLVQACTFFPGGPRRRCIRFLTSRQSKTQRTKHDMGFLAESLS
jgi:site-specific recombinase XerD